MTCITTASFSICVNGEIKGYFKGGRGLRQGDPISPYLFTLVIEAFNMIMIKNVHEAENFKYHYGCSELKLTHMCFVYDLMVMYNGDTDSLRVVKKSLDEFSRVSGLHHNLNNSTIFFRSILKNEKIKMLQILPYSCASNPPLRCFKSFKSWSPFIGKKNATYCFCSSIMQQYWDPVYLLPDTILKRLEIIFKSFMWNAGSSAKRKARVTWNLVCRLKEQGGLGLKPLKNGMKNSSDSWGWKNMLDIIDKFKPYVLYEVGNGHSISDWHDKWCDQGPLERFITYRDIYEARLDNEAKLTDVICNGNWIWPEE
ncbi:RNA-directed DNA polymerase, eukaryota, reverse transcriptase zinc-binding domain protein [Tanacetum coccineum]